MKLIKLLLTTALLSYYSPIALANDSEALCKEGNPSCTFVLLSELNQTDGNTTSKVSTVNESRANSPFSPFSTFKVANSLIALDLGVIKNTKQQLTFDKKSYPVQAWWPSVWKLPDYDLTTAFKYSMVAIYRQLAQDIGEKSMTTYLKKMRYGNEDISSGLDSFWLNGSMKISAAEQTEFLQKIYHNQFAFNDQSIVALKEVMLVETKPKYRMFAKTGAGKVDDGTMLGWYIGFVENDAGVHFFALNFNRATYAEMKGSRTKIAVNHLKLAGIIEE
mgnify:CR=1 FL=1